MRYRGGERQVARWRDVAVADGDVLGAPWKDGGVYLITGGAGGLGLIFAEAIVTHAPGACVVLAGRSGLSEAARGRVEALVRGGARVEYRALDVCAAAAVEAAVEQIVASHGALNGVIHSAGVIRDNFLIRKTEEEFRAVLKPKIEGTLNLDRATAGLPLDCFVLFSSVVGELGNGGQGDYALANAFLDRYAEYRAELVEQGRRHGRTLSIAWPLWEQGGMGLDAAYLAALRARGRQPLSSAVGLAAFDRAYASGRAQVLVLAGDEQRLRQRLASGVDLAPSVASGPSDEAAARAAGWRAGACPASTRRCPSAACTT